MAWTLLHEMPAPYDETPPLVEGGSPSPAQINRIVAVFVFSDGREDRTVELTAFQAERAASLGLTLAEFARGLLEFDRAVAA